MISLQVGLSLYLFFADLAAQDLDVGILIIEFLLISSRIASTPLRHIIIPHRCLLYGIPHFTFLFNF